MDPVTAVGFAANIIDFIDFSWNLVHGIVGEHEEGEDGGLD
jgi:hypothetical protein